MLRFAFFCAVVLSCLGSAAQSVTSDPLAITLAQQAIEALTGGVAVSDVRLDGNVVSILGSDNETGTGTFSAKGLGESRVDLKLSGGNRSDVRNVTNGIPGGKWKKNTDNANAYVQHNCWVDASWFFPGLSSLSQTANSLFVFKYIGQEQLSGVAVQHIRVFQASPQDTRGVFQRLSSMDFYFGVTSLLPVAVAFNTHADNDMNTDLPNQVLFANYQAVNGIQVPLHFQRLVNGVVMLDVNVTRATFNTGPSDSTFTLQ